MGTEHNEQPYAIFNPHNKLVEELPVIYGFNNGGRPGWYLGALLAENGYGLGSHLCSSEGYMYGDLGILEGRREDRHEGFRQHYPDGYRMDFVTTPELLAKSNPGFEAACARADELTAAEQPKASAAT